MRTLIVAALLTVGALSAYAQQVGATPASEAAPKGVFAIVDSVVIGTDEYDVAWANAQRQKFYHRTAPEAEVLSLRREVGDLLIDRVLLTAEAQRRQIAPDRAKVDQVVAGFEERYKASPQWPTIKAERLPSLIRELERQSTVDRLQESVRHVDPAGDDVLRAYYDGHHALFTEPEQIRFALILLRVDPSSPGTAWEKARDEAASIRARIENGASFEEMARLHSSDRSAEAGGDMGYVHRGMLPEDLANEISALAPGGVTQPLRLLEGVVLVKFIDRMPPKLREFEQVRERAGQLWMREESERRWKNFLAELRKGASVNVVDLSRYPGDASR